MPFHKGMPSMEYQARQVQKLVKRYLDFCESEFGKGRTSAANAELSLRPILDIAGRWDIDNLGPKLIKRIISEWTQAGLTRQTINHRLGWIRNWLRWSVSEELLPVETMQACLTVQGVRRARGIVNDPGPRRPVPWSDVEATLPQLSDLVQAMVWMQWYTGARSGTLVRAKPEEFESVGGGLIAWHPTRHKTSYKGHDLTMYLGPQCQEKVRPYLEHEPYCFDPRTVRNNGRAGKLYTVQGYRQAIQRACIRARVAVWMPHQLRHARGHLVREHFGLEAAQAVLGHASIQATQIYSARQDKLARQAAAEIG